jgi:hypothetical protein
MYDREEISQLSQQRPLLISPYEKRDYLKLQEELFEGMSVEDIYKKAREYFEREG